MLFLRAAKPQDQGEESDVSFNSLLTFSRNSLGLSLVLIIDSLVPSSSPLRISVETLTHLNRLTGYSVHYRSFTEQWCDSCGIFRDAVISIMATLAKQERVQISERTRAGIERPRRQGKTLGRPKVEVNAAEIRGL
jgi:hypothetical protein